MLKFDCLPACCLWAVLVSCVARPLCAVTYDFNPVGNFAPVPASVPANMTATNLGNGVGLNGNDGMNTIFFPSTIGNPSNGIGVRSTGTDSTEAAAITNNDYLTLTVAPDAGFVLNFQSLTFDLAASRNNNQVPNDAPYVANVAVRSSLDGFATTLQTFAVTATGLDSVVGTPSSGWSNQFLDLSGVAFQNVPVGTEFRFFLYDNHGTTSNVFRFDNFVVNVAAVQPTAAVPESTSVMAWSLMGLVIAAIYSRRHWRRSASKW